MSFVIGCSFSFEEALLQNDVPIRHIELGTNVPMYRTNIQTQRAGRFHGPMVVSMRPLKPADAIRADADHDAASCRAWRAGSHRIS